jgi:hypothetical protein
VNSHARLKFDENCLRDGKRLPKLKISHGDEGRSAFRMSEPDLSELAHPKERHLPPRLGAAAMIDSPTEQPTIF